jgi:hypothetical protein
VSTWGIYHHVHNQGHKQVYYPREGTYQGNINTVHRPDLAGQPVTKHVKLQVPYGTKNKFLPCKGGNL